jgi:hypothetical protein
LGGLLGGVDAALNPLLKALNLEIHTLPTTTAGSGSQYNVVSGGLVITYTLPSTLTNLISTLWLKLPSIGLPSIPSFLKDGFVTMTVGGATANVNAAPAFVPPADVPVTGSTPGALPASSTSGSSGSTGATGLGGGGTSSPALAASPAALAPTRQRSTTSQLPLTPIGFFKGLRLLAVLLAAVGSILLAGGLVKLSTDVLDPKAVTVCSLEGGP